MYGQRSLVMRFERAPHLARPLQRIYRLNSNFDYTAFLQAIEHTVASNPALRLQLFRNNSGWRQRFPDQPVNISEVKVKGIGRLFRSIYANLLIAEEGKSPLDLQREPPVKVKIIKVNGEYLLSLCVDHIAVDGISYDRFEWELLDSYQKVINGLPMSGKPTEPFFKYLLKEVTQKKQNMEALNLLFWEQHLKGATLGISSKAKKSSVKGNRLNYQITGQPYIDLLKFCRAHRCTLFNVIEACHLLLLNEIGNLKDNVLSIPISNRIGANEQSLIGNLFIPLYVRFSLTPNEPIPKFLIRIRDITLNAMIRRQFDYGSLMRFLSAEAKRRGTNINLTRECNLIVNKEPLLYPNDLFAERLDNLPVQSIKVNQASFNFFVRQNQNKLSINILWDATMWPISIDDMASKFLMTLKRIYGTIN